MVRKKGAKVRENSHRPLIPIDWNKADELMMAGCFGTEIAAYFSMHPETFYRRVEEEKGLGFTEYLQQKKSNGDALLKAVQYAKAIGLTDKGDNTLLIWLGKVRLEQKEAGKDEKEAIAATTERFNTLMDYFTKLQIGHAMETPKVLSEKTTVRELDGPV